MKCYKVSTEREVIDHKQLPRFPYSTVLVLSVVQWLEKVESPSPTPLRTHVKDLVPCVIQWFDQVRKH